MLADLFSSAQSSLPRLDVNGLIAAYAVLAGLLLSLNLHSGWSWRIKALSNLVVIGFLLVTYHSWPGLLGWPTSRDLPKQFYMHAASIDEPARIYLWATDLERGLGRTVPRAYALPYSTRLHNEVDKANRKLRKGLPVVGQVNPNTADETDLSLLEQVQSADTDIRFIDAPDALLPGKN